MSPSIFNNLQTGEHAAAPIFNTSKSNRCFSMRVEELFAVQRCWLSGPDVFAPVDLLRLFPSRQEAEEVAYHSAHAWSRSHDSASIRTLLLPPSQVQKQQRGTSLSSIHPSPTSTYAFVTSGAMFWVRPLLMTMTDTSMLNRSHCAMTQAFAVITDGIIGGTGKRFGRGSEVGHGRVFGCAAAGAVATLGPSGEHMHQHGAVSAQCSAQQVCDACNSKHHMSAGMGQVAAQQQQHLATIVHPIAIGKPAEYFTRDRFLQDWPSVLTTGSHPRAASITESAEGGSFPSGTQAMMQDVPTNKRAMESLRPIPSDSASSLVSGSTALFDSSMFAPPMSSPQPSPAFETGCSAPLATQVSKRRRTDVCQPLHSTWQSPMLNVPADEEMVMG